MVSFNDGSFIQHKCVSIIFNDNNIYDNNNKINSRYLYLIIAGFDSNFRIIIVKLLLQNGIEMLIALYGDLVCRSFYSTNTHTQERKNQRYSFI